MGNLKSILIAALSLTLIAGAATAALAGTNALTEDRIEENVETAANAARKQVIGAESFEQRELADGDETVVYYAALDASGAEVGYVFTATVTGKAAGLTVMTGMDLTGAVTGVAVTENNETAGYVDKVTKGGLLTALEGRTDTDVDTVSQATKTSKGVKKAVDEALRWFKIVR